MQIQTIQKGSILIARPSLLTDVFHRSVVLITEHNNKDGTVGFIINKPTKRTINHFISELNVNFPVYEGGPVDQENIYYLHKRPDLISDSERIQNGLYWSGDFNDVKYALNNGYLNNDEIRFYLGYSGWASKQLKSEIERNAWNMIADEKLNIFQNIGAKMWKQEMKKLGGENLLWLNMPENPIMN